MERAYEHIESVNSDWREALVISFDLGLAQLFSIEWLIETAERGDWSGLWW